VKEAANPLHKYTDKVVLIAKKGIVTEIDVFLRDEASIRHIDKMLTQAYGPGNEIPNPDKDTEGTNLVCTTWKGERVLLMQMQHNINHKVNGIMTRGRIQALLFTKIGDTKVDGDLPDGFAL
jgi:ribosomal protein L1